MGGRDIVSIRFVTLLHSPNAIISNGIHVSSGVGGHPHYTVFGFEAVVGPNGGVHYVQRWYMHVNLNGTIVINGNTVAHHIVRADLRSRVSFPLDPG